MNSNEIATKLDIENAKNELINFFSKKIEPSNKKILRSSDVKKMLGISTGSLQNLRISRKLKYSKINGTIFYEYDDVVALLKDNEVVKQNIFSNKK